MPRAAHAAGIPAAGEEAEDLAPAARIAQRDGNDDRACGGEAEEAAPPNLLPVEGAEEKGDGGSTAGCRGTDEKHRLRLLLLLPLTPSAAAACRHLSHTSGDAMLYFRVLSLLPTIRSALCAWACCHPVGNASGNEAGTPNSNPQNTWWGRSVVVHKGQQ